MVKAKDLIYSQNERSKIKYNTFSKIYDTIEKKIILASSSNFYSVYYDIPSFIIGCPLYNLDECKKFVINKIKENGFEVDEFDDNNIILIKWFPK
jgi:hypothetical protein